jgi:hypothetical protein
MEAGIYDYKLANEMATRDESRTRTPIAMTAPERQSQQSKEAVWKRRMEAVVQRVRLETEILRFAQSLP